MDIKKNISDIMDDIQKHSPSPEKVKLVAVTKYVDTETIKEVLKCGIKDIGENKAQVMRDKLSVLANESINWHFIGHLQTNKIKYIINDVVLIHSVYSLSLAAEINKKAESIGKIIDILLEVNISGEESKGGYSKETIEQDISSLKTLKNIRVVGLMTMAPDTDDHSVIRNVFSSLRNLKDNLNKKYFEGSLTELSMGMTSDYKIALEEGSTIIRIGSKIFS